MAEKIKLADFDIDVDELLKRTQSVKQRIDEIKAEMKEMAKAGDTSSEAFINNAVSLKELNKEYNNQLKVLGEVASANGKVIPLEQQLDTIMRRETKTINDLRKQNSDLLKTRNNLNLENEEHQKLLVEINAQYDRNIQLIKENVSEREKEQMSIGGYANAIREVIGETGLLNQAMGEQTNIVNNVLVVFQKFSPVFNQFNTELNNIFMGFRNATKASEEMTASQKLLAAANGITINSLKLLRLALIGTGIGAIVVAIGSLVAYLSSSEKAANRFSKIMKTLGGILRELMRVLEPLGEFLMDRIEEGFKLAGNAALLMFSIISKGLAGLGFEKAAASVDKFANSMINASKQAQVLADMEEKYTEAQRHANSVMLDFQRQAERLRQVRDDENKTMAARIAANEQLGEVLTKQLNTEKNIAIQALAIANLRIAQDGRTAENLDAQAEAMEKILDIEERISGQQSEQLTNRISLQNEATQKAQEAAQKRIDSMNEELELFVSQQDIRARTLEEDLQLEQQISDRRKAILQAELDAKLISQQKYETEVQNLNNELARRQAEISVAAVERELSQLENRVDIEREANRMVTQERFNSLKKQEEELREARAAYEYVRLSEGLITEQEYQDAVRQIRLNSERSIMELTNELREVQAEQRALDYESQLLALEEMNASLFEIESAKIEQQREQDLIAARQRYTDEAMLQQAILNINAQADQAQIQLEQQKNQAKWESSAQLAGALSNLLGQETAAGKAAAIAEATINTYLGATKALATLPPPASYIAMAATIASGLVSVAKIAGIGASTPKVTAKEPNTTASTQQVTAAINAVPPFATGGRVKGGVPIRRSNGDNVLATLKIGEVVLNKRQQAMLGGDSTFRAIGVPGFATGGVVGGSEIASVQNIINRQIDSVLVETIGEAVREGAQSGTATGAQQGIVDLSSERYIQNLASF